jgi:hypothetical protein
VKLNGAALLESRLPIAQIAIGYGRLLPLRLTAQEAEVLLGL